jgi:hypothetical protein
MFRSIIILSLAVSTLAAPMPLNLAIAKRDGGSAYTGPGGTANGGNINKYNR